MTSSDIADMIDAEKEKTMVLKFIKRYTGEERTMNIQHKSKGVTPKGTGMKYNPRDKGLVLVWDVTEESYKMIPVEGIRELRIDNIIYIAEEYI